MNIVIFIALILTPFISGNDAVCCQGYGKELIFCVLSIILLIYVYAKNTILQIKAADIIAVLMLAPILVNTRFWGNEAYLSISLIIIWWAISKISWHSTIIFWIIVAGVILSIISLNSIVVFPLPPLKGVLGNSGIMGIYLAIIAPLSVGLALMSHNKYLRLLYSVVSVIFLVAILLTQSRTALIGAIAGSIFVIYKTASIKDYLNNTFNTKFKKSLIISTVTIIMICVGVFLTFYRIDSVKGRLLIYRVSLDMIADSPIIGQGYNTFSAIYPEYQAAYFAEHKNNPYAKYADNTETGFNEFLHTGAEYGIVGVIVLISLIISLLRIPENSNKITLLLKGALVTIIAGCLFSYPFRRFETLFLIVVITGILMSKDRRMFFEIPRIAIFFIAPLLIWFYSSFGIIIYKQSVGYPIWQEALDKPMKKKDRLAAYQKASSYLHHNTYFLYNNAVSLSKYGYYTKSNEEFRKAALYMNTYNMHMIIGVNYQHSNNLDSAELAFKHAYNMTPNRFYPLYKLLEIYREKNDTLNIIRIANEIINKEVKIPSYTVDKIKNDAYEIIK